MWVKIHLFNLLGSLTVSDTRMSIPRTFREFNLIQKPIQQKYTPVFDYQNYIWYNLYLFITYKYIPF